MIRIDDLDDVACPLPGEVRAVLQSVSDFEAMAHERFELHRMPGALLGWATEDGRTTSAVVKWMPPEAGKVMANIDLMLERLHGVELHGMFPGRYLGLGVVSEAIVARDAFEDLVLHELGRSGDVPTVGVWRRVGTVVLASGWQLQVNRPLEGDRPRFAYVTDPHDTNDLSSLCPNLRRLSTYLAGRHP